VIYISSPDEDPRFAVIISGENIVREDGKSVAAIKARAGTAADAPEGPRNSGPASAERFSP
jgi:hypothetical protein